MEEGNSRAKLVRIRTKLTKAMEILEVQIADIDQELNGSGEKPAELTDAFFWKQVFPRLLVAGGMTSRRLREALIDGGNEVDESRFRTFLSRTRKRGLVDMRERTQGLLPVWTVTELAISQLKQRVDEKK